MRELATMGRKAADDDARRLVGLCVSFFLLFFSYFAAQNQVTPTLCDFGSLSLGLLYGTLSTMACVAPAGLRLLQRLCAHGDDLERDLLRSEATALAVGSVMYAPFPLACADTSLHGAQLAASAVLGLGAGLLWVAQGSLLTACTTEANRGRWSGIFWAAFMGGNAAGNLTSAAIVRHSSVSTMFFVLAGFAVLSSASFLLLVRPRRTLLAAGGGDAILLPQQEDALHAAGLSRDLRTLGQVLFRRETLSLLPALLFIGAENAL